MLRTDDIYDEILRNHLLSNVEQKKPLYEVSHQAIGVNLECGDEITIHVYKHHDVIHDISFHGKCCPTVKASASLMIEELRGRTRHDAIELAKRAQLLANNQIKEDGVFDTLVKQLCKYSINNNNSSFVKCALLPWETMVDATRNHVTKNNNKKRDYSLYIE